MQTLEDERTLLVAQLPNFAKSQTGIPALPHPALAEAYRPMV